MKGLYGKYIIQKADGSPVDSEADYFVLRLDTDIHARKAALAYAESIENENYVLAEELKDKIKQYQIRCFYEFNDPYYALISARSKKEAITCYEEEICELEEDDDQLQPNVVTKEYVIDKIKNVQSASEYEIEMMIKEIDMEEEETFIVLIDGSLI